MIVIEKSRSRAVRVNYIIQENPSIGSWGELQLLKHKLFLQDDDYSNWGNDKWAMLNFTTSFLRMILNKFGELHCEYCNKGPLKIYSPKERPNKNDMATADHFLPKSKFEHLRFSISNMVVCCNKCNQNKKNHIWDKSKILYPYTKN